MRHEFGFCVCVFVCLLLNNGKLVIYWGYLYIYIFSFSFGAAVLFKKKENEEGSFNSVSQQNQELVL